MRWLVARVGKGRNAWADQAVEDYARRVRQVKIEELLLRPAAFRGDVEAVRAEEGARLLGAVGAGERLVCLDERGELPTSEVFAGWLEQAAADGCSGLVFGIGGPYGHPAVVRQRAWKSLALGRWVTNHEVARVVLVEQLYRASTLIWGGSYHH